MKSYEIIIIRTTPGNWPSGLAIREGIVILSQLLPHNDLCSAHWAGILRHATFLPPAMGHGVREGTNSQLKRSCLFRDGRTIGIGA